MSTRLLELSRVEAGGRGRAGAICLLPVGSLEQHGEHLPVGTDTLLSVEHISGSNFADSYNATGFGPNSTNAGSAGALNSFEGMGGNDTFAFTASTPGKNTVSDLSTSDKVLLKGFGFADAAAAASSRSSA